MSNRRNNLLILGAVVILLAIAAYLIFLRQPVSEATRLGLDLRGGVSATLKGSQEKGQVSREEIDQAASIIRQRIDQLGVSEPEVRVSGNDQVIVNIPGITNEDETIRTIGGTAQLGFYQVLAYDEQPNVPQKQVDKARSDIKKNLQDNEAYKKGKTKILFEESPPLQGDGVYVGGYVVSDKPALTGGALRQNGANVDFNPQGKREVTLQFTGEGGRKFGDLTQKMVNDGLSNGEPSRLAIAIDDDIQSAPTVQDPILGGSVSISNDGLPEGLPEGEAQQLETVLNTGALPVDMKVISVQTIGPTLGADSLKAGLLAALIGFGLVLVFLAIIYRALGLVADLALLVYAFLLWGIVVAVPITMTLPGIAGIVLSIGVAADANVVIFERIKEEVRRGKSPRSAVQAGYEKGFRAILDGNITTIIVAFILFALSSGSVRGFAVLLAIGVALSMFTAVVVTRALLGLLSGRGVHLSPGMMGVSKGSVTQGNTVEKQRTVK